MEFRVCVRESLALGGIDAPSDSNGQPPEIATWSPSSEIFLSLHYNRTDSIEISTTDFPHFRPRRACKQVIATATDNGKFAQD